jgi:hypothetical protein
VTADFATVPVGGEVQATFRLSAAEADVAAGWTAMSWHPCLLAEVTADNDYAFQTSASGSGLQTRRNNLAQRNLTVVTMAERRSARWPFVIGHPTDRDRLVELVIDAADFAPGGRVALSLDDDGKAFPALWRAQAYAGGRLEVGKLSGAVLHKLGRGRIVVPTSPRAVVQLRLPAAGRYPLSLSVRPPRSATRRQRLTVDVAQRSPKRGVVGGASLVYNVR